MWPDLKPLFNFIANLLHLLLPPFQVSSLSQVTAVRNWLIMSLGVERWMGFNLQVWRKRKTRGQVLCLRRPTVTQCNSLLSSLLIPAMPQVNWRLPVCFQENICFEECTCYWRWDGFTCNHIAPKENWLWKLLGNTFLLSNRQNILKNVKINKKYYDVQNVKEIYGKY